MSRCDNAKSACCRSGSGSAPSSATFFSTQGTLLVSGSQSSRECPVSIIPAVSELLDRGAAVAIGVSGGKDSQAVTMALFEYLDRVGHAGPRVLIHADLGLVEWTDSLPVCERLARTLGAELVVVRHKQGGLMERWEHRWRSNVKRYEQLSTVTLVPCWSTPALRFCTS